MQFQKKTEMVAIVIDATQGGYYKCDIPKRIFREGHSGRQISQVPNVDQFNTTWERACVCRQKSVPNFMACINLEEL